MVEIEIKGLRELREAMLALPKKLDRKILNKALLVGASTIEHDAERRVPLLHRPDPRRRRGTLQRNIRSQVGKPLPGMTATVIVRVRRLTKVQVRHFKARQLNKGMRGAGADNPNDPFYWLFIERGTLKMPAQPFMRPAFEAKKYEAAALSKDALGFIVLQEAAKLGRSA